MLFFINSNLVLACSPNKIPFNLLVLIDGKKVVRNDLLNKDFIKEYNKELWYCDTGGKFRLEVLQYEDKFLISEDAIGQEDCMAKEAAKLLQRIDERRPTISIPSVSPEFPVTPKISMPNKPFKREN
jgi:hypothetical protein